MLKAITRSTLLLVAAAMMTSCSYGFIIDLPKERDGLVGFRSEGYIFTPSASPCLKWLIVYDHSIHGREVWRMDSESAPCRKVTRFRLGLPPTGFRARNDFAITTGHTYSAAAQDGEGVSGSSPRQTY